MSKIKMFFAKEWTMEEKVLVTAVTVLAGIFIGFLVSPFRSIYCGNNNGNDYSGMAGEDFGEEGEEQ